MEDHSYKRSILIIAAVAAFLTPFMGSTVNLAIPAIGSDLNIDAILLSWIATSYLLSTAVFLVPFGRLADIVGRKKIFLIGILLFTFSTLLSGFAPNAAFLIFARIVQGLGSAMIFATGIAIVTSVFPPKERGRAMGITIAAVYTGLSAGPFAGGLLTNYFGWRSIFFSTFPLGLIVFFLLLRIPGEWTGAKGEKFDLKGSVAYGLSLSSLIFGFSKLPDLIGFILTLVGIVGIIGFILFESKLEFPVMNITLFRKNRVFAFSNLAALINYSATFAVAFLLSIYLQVIAGYSPREAGLILVSQPIIMAIVSPLSGRLSDRIEPSLLASAGMSITTLGLFVFIFLGEELSLGLLISNLIFLGIGFGLFSSPNTNAIMSSVDKQFYGVASGAMGTMRLVGQMFSMGIAMLLFSLFIGREPLTPENAEGILQSMQFAFILFSGLCFLGIFASLARGKMNRVH
jgi:EmrB/QacA subfamily drug resistance transporter